MTNHQTPAAAAVHAARSRFFGMYCVLGIGVCIAAHAALSHPDDAPKNTFTSNITGMFTAIPGELKPLDNKVSAELKVGKGDTLISMLLEHDVTNQEAHEVAQALKDEYDPRYLKVGQTLALTTEQAKGAEEASVKSLAVNLPLATITLAANQDDDGFSVTREDVPVEAQPFHGEGVVASSLYQAAYDANIPEGAMAEIVSAFSFDVDFQRDIHPGNRIEVMVDEKITEDGRVVGYDNARYAKLELKGRTLEIFKFKNDRGIEDWFDAKGVSVRKSLLRTPVNAARISSGFGMRHHPILGYNRMHKGVDFAAPTGTPIYAAGDGVIAFKGRKGGYGNYIKIRHNGTYDTAYAHMHRFASGMRNGKAVKQGQVIGYVGTTGRSTGPHLHYEVLQKGRQVNPRHAKFNAVEPLKGKQLLAFKKHINAVNTELAEYREKSAPQQLAKLDMPADASAAN